MQYRTGGRGRWVFAAALVAVAVSAATVAAALARPGAERPGSAADWLPLPDPGACLLIGVGLLELVGRYFRARGLAG